MTNFTKNEVRNLIAGYSLGIEECSLTFKKFESKIRKYLYVNHKIKLSDYDDNTCDYRKRLIWSGFMAYIRRENID